MAMKPVKNKISEKAKMDAHQKRMKWLQTIFVVISIILILSMLLTSVINF